MSAPCPTPTRRWAPAALLATPFLALALSACGPADSPTASSGAPTASSGGGGGGGGQTTVDADAARDAYDLELARCMRGLGLEIADPAPGAGITETGPEVTAAASTCMAEIGDPPVHEWTTEELAALQEQYLAMAECYRGLGYEVEDPAQGEAITVPEGMTDDEFLSCEVAAE